MPNFFPILSCVNSGTTPQEHDYFHWKKNFLSHFSLERNIFNSIQSWDSLSELKNVISTFPLKKGKTDRHTNCYFFSPRRSISWGSLPLSSKATSFSPSFLISLHNSCQHFNSTDKSISSPESCCWFICLLFTGLSCKISSVIKILLLILWLSDFWHQKWESVGWKGLCIWNWS